MKRSTEDNICMLSVIAVCFAWLFVFTGITHLIGLYEWGGANYFTKLIVFVVVIGGIAAYIPIIDWTWYLVERIFIKRHLREHDKPLHK